MDLGEIYKCQNEFSGFIEIKPKSHLINKYHKNDMEYLLKKYGFKQNDVRTGYENDPDIYKTKFY